jgi:hypothetical protein
VGGGIGSRGRGWFSPSCMTHMPQVKTKHELEPVAVRPPPIDPDCELVPCGAVCSVIGALATVIATADVQPVDAVCERAFAGCAHVTVAAGHRDMPRRPDGARCSGRRVRPRQRAHVSAAICVAKRYGGASRQARVAGVLPQGGRCCCCCRRRRHRRRHRCCCCCCFIDTVRRVRRIL